MKPGDLALVSDGAAAGLVARVTVVLPDSVNLRNWGPPVPRSSVRLLESSTLLQERDSEPDLGYASSS